MKTYGPTMQCNSKILDNVKCSKCPPLAQTYALRLNYHQSIAWSMTICLSIRHCVKLSTSRIGCWQTHSCSIAKILLSTGLKSDMLRRHRFGAMMMSGISRWSGLTVVCTRCAGTLCCLNLSWFSAFDSVKNTKYACDGKFTVVYVCQKLPKESLVWQSYCKTNMVQFFWLAW